MLTQADSLATFSPFTPPPSTAAAIGGNDFAHSYVQPLIDGDAGYMLVSATGPPQQGQAPLPAPFINMQMGGRASSGDNDSDHFDGVEQIPSSTCLLGESVM